MTIKNDLQHMSFFMVMEVVPPSRMKHTRLDRILSNDNKIFFNLGSERLCHQYKWWSVTQMLNK